MPKFDQLNSDVKRDIIHLLMARMAALSELTTAAERDAARAVLAEKVFAWIDVHDGDMAEKVFAWIDAHDGDMSPHDWMCLVLECKK